MFVIRFCVIWQGDDVGYDEDGQELCSWLFKMVRTTVLTGLSVAITVAILCYSFPFILVDLPEIVANLGQ